MSTSSFAVQSTFNVATHATADLDAAAWPAINGICTVRTSSAGTFAYFEEYWDDVWRVAETGGVPELVVEDSAVANRRSPLE